MQIDDGEREGARMGFLSFNMAFYRAELRRLAETPPTVAVIYRARTLLKMLDDLADEDYTTLNEQLESGGNGAAWLRDYLRKNHAEPFPRMQSFLPGCNIAYGPQRIPLETAIRQAVAEARTLPEPQGLPCVNELRRFCQWVGYEPDTAYIFLLCDTLLPFVYYQSRGRAQMHPWLLSRQSLAQLTGSAHADDEIRAVIFHALEQGCGRDFETFCAAVLPEIRRVMKKNPQAERCLRDMLHTIRQKHILIVESGCTGTFPMLLMRWMRGRICACTRLIRIWCTYTPGASIPRAMRKTGRLKRLPRRKPIFALTVGRMGNATCASVRMKA